MPDLNKLIVTYIEHEWITPASGKHPDKFNDKFNGKFDDELDEEDRARIRLIRELQESFGVNDDSVPIILQLIDQLHCLRNLIKKKAELP